uniref:FERM domain-containing protein n=1 Tax=Sinocyclocheilus grahami TaxID=75366 RepID=A0A672RIF8_SINGR
MIDEPQIVLELPGSIVVNDVLVLLVTYITHFSFKRSALLFSFTALTLLPSLCLFIFSFFPLSLSIDTVKERQVRLCVAVKCDIKSRGRDVFDMVVAHANLVEHFYFGLAFIDGNSVFIYTFVYSYGEFFFLDPETKISKVAPDYWKKVASAKFTLFLLEQKCIYFI